MFLEVGFMTNNFKMMFYSIQYKTTSSRQLIKGCSLLHFFDPNLDQPSRDKLQFPDICIPRMSTGRATLASHSISVVSSCSKKRVSLTSRQPSRLHCPEPCHVERINKPSSAPCTQISTGSRSSSKKKPPRLHPKITGGNLA